MPAITSARPPNPTSSFATTVILGAMVLVPVLGLGCASTAPAAHGTMSTLSAAPTTDARRCPHGVPPDVCTRCHPQLIAQFKEAKDWCAEHSVPESQCFACHPDLTFDAPAPTPGGADLVVLSTAGEDVPALAPHAAAGKVTLFDFYAVWCAPCRQVDTHLGALLKTRTDVAVRKLNVVSWETPLAQRYLKDVSSLPYLIVYRKDGRPLREIVGLNLRALDKAIAEAGAP